MGAKHSPQRRHQKIIEEQETGYCYIQEISNGRWIYGNRISCEENRVGTGELSGRVEGSSESKMKGRLRVSQNHQIR